MAKVLITGGAGFIGYHLAKALVKEGHTITICDNLFRGRQDKELAELCEKSSVRLVICDLTQPHSFRQLDKGYDLVYHLAAINGTRYFYEIPDQVLRVNVLTLINTLDWFVQSHCGKFLFASSSEVYASGAAASSLPIPTPEEVPSIIDDPHNPRLSYAGSKILGELMAINYGRAHDFPCTIVRYHNVYGPRMGYDHVIPEFCIRILERKSPFPIYGALETRSFSYVDDDVRATMLVMDSSATDGQIIHLGNPSGEISIKGLAELMFDLFDFHPALEIRPAPSGSVKRRCPETSKLEKLTGFRPQTPLSTGLVKIFAWYEAAARSWASERELIDA